MSDIDKVKDVATKRTDSTQRAKLSVKDSETTEPLAKPLPSSICQPFKTKLAKGMTIRRLEEMMREI